jgi:hypothetical protein
MLEITLVLNTIWFLMAFNVFAIRNQIFAKLLVGRDQRDTPVFKILAESGKFLGGFNLAFAVLSVLLLVNLDVFPSDIQRAILLFTIAIAHGTQFVFNVPVALSNRRGGGIWQVKGTMLFIFVTDFVMMMLNLILAGMLATQQLN